MEEAPENGKESSHSAHTNGKNECCLNTTWKFSWLFKFTW